MKKKYIKPAIYTEKICLSDRMCSCYIQITTSSEAAECGYELPGLGFTLFVDGWQGCQYLPDEFGMTEQVCYQPSAENIFSS